MPPHQRTQYDWDALLAIDRNAECGLDNDHWCEGRHAPIWELTAGEDFPTTMDRHSLQAAMHTKARKRGLRCHTAVQGNGLQVQFYRPPAEHTAEVAERDRRADEARPNDKRRVRYQRTVHLLEGASWPTDQ